MQINRSAGVVNQKGSFVAGQGESAVSDLDKQKQLVMNESGKQVVKGMDNTGDALNIGVAAGKEEIKAVKEEAAKLNGDVMLSEVKVKGENVKTITVTENSELASLAGKGAAGVIEADKVTVAQFLNAEAAGQVTDA